MTTSQRLAAILPAGRMDGNYDGRRQRQRNLAVVPMPGTNWQTPYVLYLSFSPRLSISLFPLPIR